MAAWQFKLLLIPSAWGTESVASFYSDDGGYYDCSPAWKLGSDEIVEKISPVVSLYLPLSETWHSDQTSWGYKKTTDIQLWVENGEVDELQVRIDMREELIRNTKMVVDIANSLSLNIFLPSLKIILLPNQFELASYANDSAAKKWADVLGSSV